MSRLKLSLDQMTDMVVTIIEKKKSSSSARRHLCDDVSNSDNNSGKDQAEPQLRSNDECGMLGSFCDDVDSVTARANDAIMLNEFDHNAAADGLFHPASAIKAFAEHGANYHKENQHASDIAHRRARSANEFLPPKENYRLPAIFSHKNKGLSARPINKIQRAFKNGSAPASMNMASSLSKLLHTGDEEHFLSTSQSDSNLYAPRRQDINLLTADRNALDSLKRESKSDMNNHHDSRVLTLTPMDNNNVNKDSKFVVSPLKVSLASKFEELKRIMKSNQEKLNTARQASDRLSANGPSDALSPLTTHPKALKHSKQVSAIKNISMRSGEKVRSKGTLKKCSIPVASANAGVDNSRSDSKQPLPPKFSDAANYKTNSSAAAAIVPKTRNGTSLIKLRAEHQEALQILQELGGPVDLDYLQIHEDHNANTANGCRVERGLARSLRFKSPFQSLGKKPRKEVVARIAPTLPNSANIALGMVTKARDSVPSDCFSQPSISLTADDDKPQQHEEKVGNMEVKSTESQEQETIRDITAASGKAGFVDPAATLCTSLLPSFLSSKPFFELRKHGEYGTADNEDGKTLENKSSIIAKATCTSDDSYSDENFESEW